MTKKKLVHYVIVAVALWIAVIILFSILNSVLGLDPGDQRFINGAKVLINSVL